MDVQQLEAPLVESPRAQPGKSPVAPEADLARGDGDWSLIDALRRREPTAAERLVSTYGDRAYRLAIRITGNAQDAEEVVQDAFWSVVRKIDSFRGAATFGSWLYRIVANAAYGTHRRRHGRYWSRSLAEAPPVFDEDGRHHEAVADWSARLDNPSVQSDLRLVLTAAIDGLPLEYRAVVVLYDVEGLSHREIGEVLGITVACAKTRVRRARLRLRQQLAGYMAARPRSVPPSTGAGDGRLDGAARRCAAMIAHGRAADAMAAPALRPAWRGPGAPFTQGLPGVRLRRVVVYVEANLAGALRLAELSALVRMSPYHFARLFKQRTGVSPRQFVICRRIDAAKRLLAEPGPLIRDVARAVGFCNQSHFTTCFQRITGVTPRHYRGAVQVEPPSAPPVVIRSGDEYRILPEMDPASAKE
jgi:RNA polymerase sigma factor (sigma-70 family)